MTTEISQFPCNASVSIKGVEDVAGKKGPQWKLTCEFPWTGNFPEVLWVATMPDWKPTAGETYDCVVNRRDLKKDKDADTEWNWRHYINSFTPDPVLDHWQKPGYSSPSNQSPPAEPQGDEQPTPVAVSSGTIGGVLGGSEFGMLYKAAIEEGQRYATLNKENLLDINLIHTIFMDLLRMSLFIKSQPMPTSDPEPRAPDEQDRDDWEKQTQAKISEPDWSDAPEDQEPQE